MQNYNTIELNVCEFNFYLLRGFNEWVFISFTCTPTRANMPEKKKQNLLLPSNIFFLSLCFRIICVLERFLFETMVQKRLQNKYKFIKKKPKLREKNSCLSKKKGAKYNQISDKKKWGIKRNIMISIFQREALAEKMVFYLLYFETILCYGNEWRLKAEIV